MKNSTWRKTTDNPNIEPTIRWGAKIGDRVDVVNMAGGYSVTLDPGPRGRRRAD